MFLLGLTAISPAAFGDEPAISAVSRDLTPAYKWNFSSGVKQQHGSYKNGRSLHAVLQRTGTTGATGYPDYLVWFDEHTGQTAAGERVVAYPERGKNPATQAVFASDAPAGQSLQIWWVMGGRASTQPFDLYRTIQPFDPFVYERVLDNFVSELQSTTPGLAIVGETGLIPYRWGSSGSTTDELRLRKYSLPATGLPVLQSETKLGRASTGVPGLDYVTIEQLWSRWDPRRRAFALTWQWFQHNATTPDGKAFGSNPFLYTDDLGATWKSADGATVNALPLTYSSATASSVITPHQHLALGENTEWQPRDIGFTPGGAPWITLHTGPITADDDGWTMTFFRWGPSSWREVPISNDMQGNADAMGCGPLRDYLICAYSEVSTPGSLLVKVSRDDGLTWSAPVAVDNVGLAGDGSLQRINWVSYAQPSDRYLDNTARFFIGYYRVGELEGQDYKNRLRWVRVQVGPRADFNGDGVVDDADLAAFQASYNAAESRADFNDDGTVDARDLDEFTASMSGYDPPLPPEPPPPPPPSSTPNTGTGLAGQYFNNQTLSGTPVLQRTEAVNFGWGTNSPGPGVGPDNFSVRWTGLVEAPSSGQFIFRTVSNDGVRLWINGNLVIDNWPNHATTTNDAAALALVKNQRYSITMEFHENTGAAVARLKWKKPGQTTFAAVPKTRLYLP